MPGIPFTVTLVVPAALVHPAIVAVTVYVPEEAGVGDEMLGFCKADVNPLGPVHE